MNESISRAKLVRAVLASALLVPLLLWVSGCWLFNVPPIAAFTINSQAGQAPFAVNFSAVLSEDDDGIIIQFEWDFGDGTSGSGENVTHTYTAAGTFSVVLRVTDDDGETATNGKTIYVSPAEPPGPAASFTASPTSGASTWLTVRVDASASSYDAGVISQWVWDWGDGSSYGYGERPWHTYSSAGAVTYTITLTVTGTDGKTGTATRAISLTPAGSTTPTAGAPSARFTINFNDITTTPTTVYANHDVAPLQVWFDPGASVAVTGQTIASYTWTFGDGSSAHSINSAPVKHVYRTALTSKVFSVTLVVIDDVGSVNSITKTVRVYNYQPRAGFEVYDTLGANSIANEASPLEQDEIPAAGDWEQLATVTFTGVQTDSTTVWIRSLPPTLPTWVGDPTTPLTIVPQGTASTEPANFGTPNTITANLCFDPEGQGWDQTPPHDDKTIMPAGWASVSWGIERIEINWGDTNIRHYDYYDWVMHGIADEEGQFMHTYAPALGSTTSTYTITVTAHDFLGAQASFSRIVTMKAGT